MRLIIIRGNSGCGKSSTALLLRERLEGKVALVEQDVVRRKMLGETGKQGDDNIDLIEEIVMFSLNKGYTVILEGILHEEYYGNMLRRLCAYANPSYVFYFDVSLEETIRRHETKSNKHEFGRRELEEWYRDKDYLKTPNETILPESFSQSENLQRILDIVSESSSNVVP